MDHKNLLLQQVQKALALCSSMNLEEFSQNQEAVSACARHLSEVGYSLERLDSAFTDRYPTAPWHDLRMLQFTTSHSDSGELWAILTNTLPLLQTQLLTEGIHLPEPLFSTEIVPSFGFFPDLTSQSITISRDFTLTNKLRNGNHHLISQTVVSVPPKFVEDLEQAITTHWDEISSIPSKLYNGSLDGSYYIYQFKDVKISALNISRTDLEEVKQRNPSYYDHYLENMKQENAVLDLFDTMMLVFQQHEISIPDYHYP